MPFGLSDHLATMSRVVTSSERDGRPAKAVVASRVYPTGLDDLWDAVTNPDRLEAGTPSAEAHSAAERTRAFYAGEAAPQASAPDEGGQP